MRFDVLGPLAVRTEDGRPVPIPEAKVRALLADLLTYEGRPVPPDRLIEDLWGRRLPRNPAATLQTRVSQLRRALAAAEPGGRDLVEWQPAGYRLAVPAERTDAGRFRALAARAHGTDDPRVRERLLTDALALWRGPAYAGFTDEEFARPAAGRLDEERVTALGAHAQARLDLGEHHTLASDLGDLVAEHPLCERLRAVHLRALYRAGRQSEALASYAHLRERLAEELGVDPGPELTALHEAILTQDPALQATAPPRPPTNLPAAVTRLTGRADALAELRALLRTNRLLTLTGPGGVGKTSLALEAARDALSRSPDGDPETAPADGVWLVDLAGLDRDGASAAAVAGAIAAELGLREEVAAVGAGDVPGGLAGVLAGRRLLLVLDTCEHIVEPAAEVAGRLLRAAPGLRILATGQEPLAIAGERLWSVPPLPVPPVATAPCDAASFGAVELFAGRAAAAAPGFRLGPDNAAAVAVICRRLDGIPLALELAAARVRALGVAELAARLDDRFAVLTDGRRGAPARQRSLRAVLGWSWEPLSPPERTVLDRLAAHEDVHGHGREDGDRDGKGHGAGPGIGDGISLADAEEAAGVDGADFLTVLGRLVDRSLVVMAEGRDGPRYFLPESVRAYALERLRETTAPDRTARRRLHVCPAASDPADQPWPSCPDRSRPVPQGARDAVG